jgi:hypothetical protein
MIALACVASPAFAASSGEDDAEIDLIPDSVLQEESTEKTEKPSAATWMLDNVTTHNRWRSSRSLIVPVPSTARPLWSNLLQLGLRGEARPSARSRFSYDTLLLTEKSEDVSFRFRDNTHFFVKEAYASLGVSEGWFFDAGRINFRSGVGVGFNPTDYFRTNALISRTTEDPSQLRTNRLGTLGVRTQKIAEQNAWTLVLAPEVSENSPRGLTDADLYGLNLDRTNDRTRVLLRYAHTFGANFAPEGMLYWEDGSPHAGWNLSYAAGQKTLLYWEGDVGRRRSLVDEALLSFRQNGTLTRAVGQAFGSDRGERYLKQSNIGTAYTNESNITFNFEFHYNEAGLSAEDWRNWFRAGQRDPRLPTQGQLWSIRQLGARERQEPLSRREFFLRANWPEVIWPDLTLTGLVVHDAEDRSRLFQLEGSYALAARTSVKLRYAHFGGEADSNFGSSPTESTINLQLTHVF